MAWIRLIAEPFGVGVLFALVATSTALTIWFFGKAEKHKKPARLKDRIPFFSNTYQYMTNQKQFLNRVAQAMKTNSVVRFYLGPSPVYLIAGAQNIQAMFGPSHKIGNEELLLRTVLPKLYGLPKHELKHFAQDKSGRGKIPVPGTEHQAGQRYWFTEHNIHSEFMSRTKYLTSLSQQYYRLFSETLDQKQPVTGEWTSISVSDLCRNEMAQCAVTTLVGPHIFESNPKLTDLLWEFDAIIFPLVLGLPSWLNPQPLRVRDRWNESIKTYLNEALQKFDWNGKDAEAEWEPIFGARVCRELVRWLRESDFQSDSIAGFLGTFLWAQNSNSIPIATWAIIELVRDPVLFQAVREEVRRTESTDPTTGSRTIDVAKLLVLPLLQAVFTESLRLHMSFNVIRQIKEPMTVGGYRLEKGAMLQAPMQVAHHDESWIVDDHPTTEFWAGRHLKEIETTDEVGNIYHNTVFSLGGRSSSYFPFGGGISICPGRQFAKHEMLITLGLLVSKFDFEFVEWTKLDGSPSDRPGEDDARYAGGGAMPPDRDMKVRWRRVW